MSNDKQIVLGPCSEKQRMVLLDDTTDILVQGGSAGSGKSYLALLKALNYCDDPAARVGIFRLTYPQLAGPGGLIDESKQLYSMFGASWRAQPKKWIFPNGAEVQFMAVPEDLTELQGLQFTTIICDEGAEFTQEAILALKARLRGARYKGKISMMITCNPSRSSYLYDWVKYSLDPDTGIPRQGTENAIRWFVMINSKMYWADSKEQLFEEYGKGFTLGVDFLPTSVRYIPMNIYDNPVLMKNNPGYLANLMSMSRVNQLRFLKGSWTAVVEGSSMVKEEDLEIIDHPPINPVSKARGWDLAASIPNESNNYKCDWTAGVLMSRDKFGTYYIEDVVRFQKQIDGVLKEIQATAERDGLDIPQILPSDPGQAGKVATRFYIAHLAENGVTSRTDGNGSNSGKVTRFGPFSSITATKSVKLVRGDWNREYIDELCRFNGDKKTHDDQVDATSSVFNTLARQVTIPSIRVPDMTQASPVPRI